jgi:hypothetical protein
MNNIQKARLAGLICMTSGTLFFLYFTTLNFLLRQFQLDPAVVSIIKAGWGVVACGLMGGSIGLLTLKAFGSGWQNVLGLGGTFFNVLGTISYFVGSIYIYNFPDRALRQFFTPGGSILLAAGMLLVAIAVLTVGRLGGWRAFAPLLVALYFPLQFPLQTLFFLGGGRGPNPILLGCWGLCWMLLGYAIWSSGRKAARGIRNPEWNLKGNF